MSLKHSCCDLFAVHTATEIKVVILLTKGVLLVKCCYRVLLWYGTLYRLNYFEHAVHEGGPNFE